jgi:predicted XRE-type DNA-binding protein
VIAPLSCSSCVIAEKNFATAIDLWVRLSETRGMNWTQIISEICEASGLNQSQIAQRTGIAKSSLSELLSGSTKEPRFSTGEKLLNMHRRLTRKSSKSDA